MADPTTDVRIRVNKRELSEWKTYDIESDLLQAADAFTFTASNAGGKLAGLVKKFDPVEVLVDGVVQMTGFVDDLNWGVDPGSGAEVEIVGRDNFGQLVDNSADPKTYHGLDLKTLAHKIAGLWVDVWIVHNEGNRRALTNAKSRADQQVRRNVEDEIADQRDEIAASGSLRPKAQPIDQFEADTKAAAAARFNLARLRARVQPRIKVAPGDSIFDTLAKAARKAGLLVWNAADGTGVIAAPNYDQDPLYALFQYPPTSEDRKQNNCKTFRAQESGREQFKTYRYAATSGNTKANAGRSSIHEHTIEDSDVPIARKLILTGATNNRAEAKSTAEREQQKRRFAALEILITAKGHKNRGRLWQIDTLCSLVDEVAGFSGVYYITKRRFSGSRDGGQTTAITLRSKGLFLV